MESYSPEQLPQIPQTPWIACDTRLPEHHVWVMVIVRDTDGKEWADVSFLDETRKWTHEQASNTLEGINLRVVWWMPIPDWPGRS